MHAWEGDPRLQATPDYGSLGPGPDLKPGRTVDPQMRGARFLAAVGAGVLMALVVAAAQGGVARAAWSQISDLLTLSGKPKAASPAILSGHEIESLDRDSPQAQAQLLLERAVNHYEGANDQIAARVEGWRGKLQLTPQLNSLVATALNSNDLRVRAAGIEVDLAAMGVAKTPASVDGLAQEAEASGHPQRVWALWTLGLLGNRGVEPERIAQILIAQLRDSDPETRHWAVEGLAYLGTDATIAPLLQVFHDDESPMVRERAACSLAQSGMLSQEQRHSALPQLLNYTEDASLDAQTRSWVYQALRDITGQSLPNDPGAWRTWYGNAAN